MILERPHVVYNLVSKIILITTIINAERLPTMNQLRIIFKLAVFLVSLLTIT